MKIKDFSFSSSKNDGGKKKPYTTKQNEKEERAGEQRKVYIVCIGPFGREREIVKRSEKDRTDRYIERERERDQNQQHIDKGGDSKVKC